MEFSITGKVLLVKAVGVRGKRHVPVTSPPANEPQYALNTRLIGPHRRSGPFEGKKVTYPKQESKHGNSIFQPVA
jgi:hypothetical protein